MSDRMIPIPFDRLIKWAKREWEQRDSVFGVHSVFAVNGEKYIGLAGERMEMPIGPAAGPHTQLAQNIIAAYIAGCRFFELKTVQTLDGEDLPVSKPCISAKDECYNVEWSTELRVEQAMNEYIKAYFALKLLSGYFGLGKPDGFVFNMSVGYDLEGIKSKKIDDFIEGLKDAGNTAQWKECVDVAGSVFPNMRAYIDSIPSKVCSSVTLSTLHGCPPAEIERIATYLIEEKSLNTFVKCNPTLLGYEFVRKTMDDMGYGYMHFDDSHFKADLQFGDAIPMLKRLKERAEARGLLFGVKLTNTMPVDITRNELPGDEMYMSGRALYPLTAELAYRIAKEFDGNLRISFSGGADAFNICDILSCGIYPITFATTLLKTGGYNRASQLAQLVYENDYPSDKVDVEKVRALAEDARCNVHHLKGTRKSSTERKIKKRVPKTDCFIAPCQHGCPINQHVSEYIELCGKRRYKEALETIMRENPLPSITGTICPHRCMSSCTRNFYETPVQIRDTKLIAAVMGHEEVVSELHAARHDGTAPIAIIGGGPAGIATAYFLAVSGKKPVIFEKASKLGGTVATVIPDFRISDEAIARDVAYIEKLGVEVRLNTPAPPIDELRREGFETVILAIGAMRPVSVNIEGETDALDYLAAVKQGKPTGIHGDVVVIGAGNTAMDTARTAMRDKNVKSVTIAYRRTREYMPADEEELKLALDEGVLLREQLSPVYHKDRELICSVTAPDGVDESGRVRFVPTGENATLPADCVIAAAGSKLDDTYLVENGLTYNKNGELGEGIYIIGDARSGAATVVEAIADARRVADKLTGGVPVKPISFKSNVHYHVALMKHATLCEPCVEESDRCLNCSTVCESCVDVCPNRANVTVTVAGIPMRQIIHIDDMCNECGNCETFCPYTSSPYKDKLTYFSSLEHMADSTNEGFVITDAKAKKVHVRLDDEEFDAVLGDESIPQDINKLIEAFINTCEFMYR